ncbi:papain-like cysteine protease family protein [Streptomyces sp. NPDC054863]
MHRSPTPPPVPPHRVRRRRGALARGGRATAVLMAALLTAASAPLVAAAAPGPTGPPPAKVSGEPKPPAIHHSRTWSDAPVADREHSRVLRVEQQPQEDPGWDWAAAAATVTRYYGKSLSQNQLCHRAEGSTETNRPCARNSGDIHDVQRALDRSGVTGSRVLGEGLTFDRLRKEIDAGRPVVGHLEVPGTELTHTVVAYGYDAPKHWVYWTDSWPTASPYSWADFEAVLSHSEFRLTAALINVGPGRPVIDQPAVPRPRAADDIPGKGGGSTWNSAKQASATAELLPFTQHRQEQDEWCWAATGSAIAAYWGKKFTQTQYCNMGHGMHPGDLFFGVYCENAPASLGLEQRALSGAGLDPGERFDQALTFAEVKKEIDAGRPIYSGIRWTNGGGHAQVIFGYDDASKRIYWTDPWPTSPRYNWAPIGSYTKNSSYYWNHGLKDLSGRARQS